ncbi:MAG: ABC transporter ATP-binding protein, partial [Myxococcota bacterium]
MKIEVRSLTKVFGSAKAVDNLSFSFASGSILGFIGPNGAGKTTTIKTMATLHEPTRGDIFFDGISVVNQPEDVRRIVGYMPDALPAHRDITVREYLDFFCRAYQIRGAKRQQVLEEVELFTGVTSMRDKFLKSLSKGMKQRVSLARALLHDPEVLIMDEPAAGLDPRARIELRELLKVLCAQNKAIFVSSHILTELAEICTDTVIIERGKLVHTGALDRLV